MDKINIIYWSQSGNTEAMANAVAEGVKEASKEAEVLTARGADLDVLKNDEVFALGCPASGSEELDDSEMEPLVKEIEGFAAGKKIALFGSYGWGGGDWMREWENRLKNAGAEIVGGEGLICQEAPDEDMLKKCSELGVMLASEAK